jgi:hypothetical protein
MAACREAIVLRVKRSEVAAGIVAGVAGTFVLDLFLVPALVILTVVLILGVAFRAPALVLACAISCGLMVALWILAIARCDQTLQDCTVSPLSIAILSWLAAGLVVGVVATWTLSARSRTS